MMGYFQHYPKIICSHAVRAVAEVSTTSSQLACTSFASGVALELGCMFYNVNLKNLLDLD